MASLRVETRYAASWPGYDQGVQNVNDARDISLPSEVSHRDVGVNPDVFFASDRSGRWYAQTKQRGVRGRYGVQFSINGTPAKGCVRLQAGDVLELKYQGGRPVAGSAVGGAEPVGDRAVVEDVVVRRAERRRDQRDHHGHLGHSTSTYALAATCRAGRAAVDRWLAPLIPQLVKRSLWLLVGEKWPLTVLHAKVDAKPDECKAELVEMLTPDSFCAARFPFAAHIQRSKTH